MIVHRHLCNAPQCALMVVDDQGEANRLMPLQSNDGSNVFVFRVSGYPAGTWEHYARAINADGSNGERGESYTVTVDA